MSYTELTPHIVTTQIEHHAILNCCRALEKQGVEITYLPVDAQGFVNPRDLEDTLAGITDLDQQRPGVVALVSIMLANNEVGTIEPIRRLAEISHAFGAPFHTDAVQAVGHIPVDVQELGVDALSLSAHKFHGPRGVGALYLRNGFSLPPLISGGSQERGVRAGTENVAGAVGMAEALLEACDGLDERAARLAGLRDELTHHLATACLGITPTGPKRGADRLPSIASFACHEVDGELLVVLLDRAGVGAATGSACSTGSIAPSHVLTALGLEPKDARGALRLSLADGTTREELELLKERVPAAVKRARAMSGTRS